MFSDGRSFPARKLVLLLTGLLLASPVVAQDEGSGPGKLQGKVLEAGGQPVPYANVIIKDLKRGALTDEKGSYVLVQVPPGTYEVTVQSPAHVPKTITLTIGPGQTLTQNITLGEERITEIEEIVVTGERQIDTKTTQTTQTISAKDLQELPVDNLQDAVATKAGIVAQNGNLHVRGGRGGEVKFQFDGIEVTDPQFGQQAGIANLSIAGTEILSGGFDAEFGNALSGVVSVSTKEGTERFGGQVRWDTDRYLDPTKTFNNYDRFTFGFGGPTPVRNLTYFATYEGTFTDTYLRTSLTKPQRSLLEFIQLGNRQTNLVNTNLKLAYRPNPRHKFTLETINNQTITTPYNHMWSRQGFVKVDFDTLRTAGQPDTYSPKYGSWSATQEDSSFLPVNMPDHVPTLDSRFSQYTGVWTNQLSDKSVWTSRLSRLEFDSKSSVGGKEPWEYWTQSPFYWSGNTDIDSENQLFFASHGDFPTYFERNSATWAFKSDLSTRTWRAHTFKTGIDARYNRVSNLSLTLPNSENNGLPGGTRSEYINYNPEGAAYVQDRWEYEGLVLNAGLRYDVFTPGPQINDDELPSGLRYKAQFSPRLGIAYPISDRDVLSFHYGWTFQTPARNFVFENRGVTSAVAIRGNPDLEPETNIAYQAGVQHLFSRDVSGQFSVFFKDIYGLITTRQEADEFGNLVAFYFNGDYASSRGFEASLIKSFSHKFSAQVNYTFSLATGVASNPNDALQFFNGGQLYLPISEQALDWDQRHTVSVQGVIRDPGKWGLRMLWQYGSGFPFTPAFRNDRRPDPVLNNSRRLPATASLTIDGDKYFRIWGQNMTIFVDARNILDSSNISGLSQGTFPNPFVNASGDEYTIYYTETNRTGGAYLQDTNGDGVLDWVPVNDPRVLAEGRNVRLGVSITF